MDDFDRQSLRKRLAYWPGGKALKVNKVRASIRPEERVLETVREGDELSWYGAPRETWDLLCGRSGFALVREGEIVSFLCTVIN